MPALLAAEGEESVFTNPVIGGERGEDHGDPFVLRRGGEYFLLYVSATTMGADGEGVEADRHQGIARAHDPLGPFTWDPQPLVRDAWSIDGHPFGGWLFTCGRTRPAAATSSTACSRPTASAARRTRPRQPPGAPAG
jgi:hypothetical protein